VKEKLFMIVFVLLLGSAWTTALVVVDRWATPIIEKQEAEKLCLSILGAFDIDCEGVEDIQALFKESITTVTNESKTIYKTADGAIAFVIKGSGSQGPISGVMALMPDMQTIKGITIVKQQETPGLGDRVFEKVNLDKYKGKKIVPQLLIVAQGTANEPNEVDGITGATLTGTSFEKILNKGIKQHVPSSDGGQQ
jgi:Na+-transporting NADH:ubiquinone oxidoreductase subunit C